MVTSASPDAPITFNEKGGGQSHIPARYDLVPGEAIDRIAEVAAQGAAKYADNNWRLIPFKDHINHALMHLSALLQDDDQDDHLGHALTRLSFAVATEPACPRFSATPPTPISMPGVGHGTQQLLLRLPLFDGGVR